MSKVWTKFRLAELGKVFTDGDWIETKHQSSDGIRLIQTGNIGIGKFKNKKSKSRYISDSTFKKLNCTEIFENDCLVSRLPDPVGRSCILPNIRERMITAVDCTIIRFDQKKIIPEFFNYYSQSLQYLTDVDMKTTGATRKRISRKNLGEIQIPVPPIPEQKRIVAILDKAFAAIERAKANTEKNLANARELFESYLNKIYDNPGEDWEEKKLGEVSYIINGYSFSSKDFSANNKISSIKITNVGIREFVEDSNNKLPAGYEETYKNYLINSGDIVIALTRTIISGGLKVAIVPNSFNKSLLNQRVAAIRPNLKQLLTNFLFGFLSTSFVLNYVKSKANTLMQPNLSIFDLKNLKIPLPNIIIQKQIVEKLENISSESQKLETIYQQKLEDLEELKKSILQKAFDGQLTIDN